MANKAWVDASRPNGHQPPHLDAPASNGKQSASTSGWGKHAFVNATTSIRERDEQINPRSTNGSAGAEPPQVAASSSRRELPPHLRNASTSTPIAPSIPTNKPLVNGWSKIGASSTTPANNGTTNGRVVVGFKPIPTGPRTGTTISAATGPKSSTPFRKLSIDQSTRLRPQDRRLDDSVPTGTGKDILNGQHVRGSDSGIHIRPQANGSSAARSTQARSGMSVFDDDFEFRKMHASSGRREGGSSPPPPPPQDDVLPPPPSPPPPTATAPATITADQTERMLKSPEVRGKIKIGLGIHTDGEASSGKSLVSLKADVSDPIPQPAQNHQHQQQPVPEPEAEQMTEFYPWIPPSPRTIHANPPDLTRHIPGRGNFKTCDPAIHHPANGKEEKSNTGCGRAFKHEKPISRYDGAWQGKDVDTSEVTDPREEMEAAVREKGMGSKKNAYKGLYQIDPYDWDDNSPFPKPPVPPDGICISNINPLITLGQIEAAVSSYGKTKNIDMKLDPRTGMQMGICYITFQPGEERKPGTIGPDKRKKPSTMVEIPAWQIARKAQQRLNGKSIGMNVGGQKESVMKVVLDRNGEKAKKAVEMELERRRRSLMPAAVVVPPVVPTPAAQSPATWAANTPAMGATPAPTMINAGHAATPMPPPTMGPPSRVPPARNPETSPKAFTQLPLSLPSRPMTFDARGQSRGNDRVNAGYGTPGYGNSNANGRTYRDSLANSKSFEIGRLPPPSASSSYGSIRMSSSYTPNTNTFSSFVAAPFAKSRARDARMPPARARAEDGRRGSISYNEPIKSTTDKQHPPSALESYHRRSSRSRRSSSVSRTESDPSDSNESSEGGGRTPSPVYRRGARRGSERDARAPARRSNDQRGDPQDEANEADELIAKVRADLQENGRAYIFIDHRSLPIPHKVSDRERVLVDLKDHLKAVRIEKVTYNLHGWYILFPDDTAAKRTQMVFDKKVMSGRSLALSVREPLSKAAGTTPVKSTIMSPAKSKWTPKSEGSGKKMDTPSARTRGLPSSFIDDGDSDTNTPLTVNARTPVSRGTKKQKFSRVVSSDNEEVAQADENAASVKSADSVDKDLDVAPETVEDVIVAGTEDSVTVTSMDIVDDNANVQLEDVEEPGSRTKKRAGKNKRKSETVGKPAKQPPKKKQKKTVPAIAIEVAEPQSSPMEDVVAEAIPTVPKSAKASSKFKNVIAVAETVPDLSLFDLVDSGIAADDEDLYYLRLAAEHSLNDSVPDLPPDDAEDMEEEPETPHPSGCARAQGYYKVPEVEKSAYLPQRNRAVAEVEAAATNASAIATSRSTRVNSRRLVQGMEQHKKGNANATDTDLFQFNQLRTRKKQLKFSKSPIHDWGLYAMEHITQGEMVIEYVGEVIRAQVADIREKWYEKTGIGSSYLFRVDDDAVVDATKKGNLGRLINHCCYPNCTAKIITINGEKKIVIYAKSNIEPGEEITYDYHFPIEQEKIPCLCGSDKCRGYLN